MRAWLDAAPVGARLKVGDLAFVKRSSEVWRLSGARESMTGGALAVQLGPPLEPSYDGTPREWMREVRPFAKASELLGDIKAERPDSPGEIQVEDAEFEIEIPKSGMSNFQAAMARLSKRAEKLGVAPPEFEVVKSDLQTITIGAPPDILVRHVPVLTIRVKTPELKLAGGWRFIGSIEHKPHGNRVHLQSRPPGLDVKKLRTRDNSCEHCNLDRKRKETVLLQDDHGHLRHVGRSCVKDFTGHGVPLSGWDGLLADMKAELYGIADDAWGNGGGGGTYSPTDQFLALVAADIRETGSFVPMSSEDRHPTAASAWMLVGKKNGHVTAADHENAQKVLAWARGLPDDANDFLHNVKVTLSAEHLGRDDIGFAAAAFPAYERATAEAIMRSKPGATQHLGAVGDKIGTTKKHKIPPQDGRVVAFQAIDGAYGTSYLVKVQTGDGNIITSFMSNPTYVNGAHARDLDAYGLVGSSKGGDFPDVGDHVRVVGGTVKRHDNFRGTAQTVVSRMAIERANLPDVSAARIGNSGGFHKDHDGEFLDWAAREARLTGHPVGSPEHREAVEAALKQAVARWSHELGAEHFGGPGRPGGRDPVTEIARENRLRDREAHKAIGAIPAPAAPFAGKRAALVALLLLEAWRRRHGEAVKALEDQDDAIAGAAGALGAPKGTAARLSAARVSMMLLQGARSRGDEVVKASVAPALFLWLCLDAPPEAAKGDPSERWITVHPHGDAAPGHPVLIRVNPKNPNRGRIIGGAGGALNHLEIHLKSPEEYRRQAAERRKARRLKKAGMSDSERMSRSKALAVERERHAATSRELTRQAAHALGWDPSVPEGADEAEHHKRLADDVRRAVTSARELLMHSSEARAQAGMDPIPLHGDDDRPGASDLLGGPRTRGLGYMKTRADLGDGDLRAEKARTIEHSMGEALKGGDEVDASIQARRLAHHKSISESEIDDAPPAVLAGFARAIGGRIGALQGATMGEDGDEERDAAIDRLERLAGEAKSQAAALEIAASPTGQSELREALKAAVKLGLFDPAAVERMEAEAERKRFEQVGAPSPDEITADQIKDLAPAAVVALTREVAMRTRRGGGDLHREAADLGGRDPKDSKTVDLDDLIAAKRNADDVQEEAGAVEDLGDVEAQRVLLAKALAAGVIGRGGEDAPPDLEKAAGRNTLVSDPKAAARLLVLAGRLGKAKRESVSRRRRIERGEDVEGVDYESDDAPTFAGKGGVADISIDHAEVAKVAESIEDRMRTSAARNFLSKVDEAGDQAKVEGDLSDDEVHGRLAPHLSVGASSALADHSLTMLGSHAIDRQVVDTLGSEAAAAVLAHAVHTSRPDDVDALAEAVGKYHQGTQAAKARAAEEEAREAYVDAHDLHQHMTEEGKSGDLRVWQRLHEQRQAHLDRAEGALGRALGHMEATAALHLALQRKAPDEVRAHLGPVSIETAAKQLRALGLDADHYRIEHDGENAQAVINRDGLNALVKPADPENARVSQHLDEIRAGHHDEIGWLPDNFARRSEAPPYDGPPAPTSARPLDVELKDHGSIEDALATYVGQRVNDGWGPEAILSDLQSGDHLAAIEKAHAPVDQFDMFAGGGGGGSGHDAGDLRRRMAAWIDGVFPVTHAGEGDTARRLAEHSTPLLRNLGAAVGEGLHGQALHPDHADDATFRALARHPAAVGVFKPAEDLTHSERAALREALIRYGGGDAGEEHMRAWHDANPEPDPAAGAEAAQTFDMFAGSGTESAADEAEIAKAHAEAADLGDHSRALAAEVKYLEDHVKTLHKRAKAGDAEAAGQHAEALPELHRLLKEASDASDAHRVAKAKHRRLSQQGKSDEWKAWFDRKAEALDEARRMGVPPWEAYVRAHGSTTAAYRAVQDMVRGRFLADVKGHHDALSQRPLRAGATPINGWRGHLHATDPEWRDYNEHMRRVAQGAIQARGSAANAGHFAADKVRERIEKRLETNRAAEQQQTTVGTGESGDARDAMFHPGMPRGGHERLTLGEGAEKQIGEIVNRYAPMVNPSEPFTARLGNRMDGRFIHQQRAIKALVRGKKMLMGLGVGAGKTAVAFGALGELRRMGRAARGLFVVPAAVQGQFGGEALAFLKPGAMQWYADPKGDRNDRHAAYSDPNRHMVVVTHQSLRDDVTKMVAEHHGMSPAEARDMMVGRDADGKEIQGWSPQETDAKVAAALKAKGADRLLDFVAVDEGHEGLNRQGKEDSHLARVLDSLGRLSKHTGWFTGSPVKNDASEVFDWLAKVDPEKYNDRAEFMRRYGGDLPGAAAALRREMGRYAYLHKTDPGTDPQEHVEVLQPTDAHKQELTDIQHAYERARFAARRGEVDVASAKALSPALFARHAPEDHERVARELTHPLRLASARDAAIARSINLHPESAKMSKALDLAKQYKATGRPGVIFARSLDAVARIKEELGKAGINALTYTGEHSTGEKDDTRQRFTNGEGDVLVVSDAGRAGLNLQRANWLANYDIPHTFMTTDQRQGRINRTGQEFAFPDIHHLVLDHPNEHKALERVQKKKALHSALYEGAGEPLDQVGLAPYIRETMAGRDSQEAAG